MAWHISEQEQPNGFVKFLISHLSVSFVNTPSVLGGRAAVLEE